MQMLRWGRFVRLTMNVDKTDSPREHLPFQSQCLLPPPVSATIRIAVGARCRRAHLYDQQRKCDLCLSPLRKVNVGE